MYKCNHVLNNNKVSVLYRSVLLHIIILVSSL